MIIFRYSLKERRFTIWEAIKKYTKQLLDGKRKQETKRENLWMILRLTIYGKKKKVYSRIWPFFYMTFPLLVHLTLMKLAYKNIISLCTAWQLSVPCFYNNFIIHDNVCILHNPHSYTYTCRHNMQFSFTYICLYIAAFIYT